MNRILFCFWIIIFCWSTRSGDVTSCQDGSILNAICINRSILWWWMVVRNSTLIVCKEMKIAAVDLYQNFKQKVTYMVKAFLFHWCCNWSSAKKPFPRNFYKRSYFVFLEIMFFLFSQVVFLLKFNIQLFRLLYWIQNELLTSFERKLRNL